MDGTPKVEGSGCKCSSSMFPCLSGLSGPNRAMQPRCAMRFELHTPKSLAMRKSFFFLAMRKHIRLIWNHRKMQEKTPAKILRCWAAMRKSGCFLRSTDAKCLRFGLPLRFGLRCERSRCQIASDSGQAMRATKLVALRLAWWPHSAIAACKFAMLGFQTATKP